MSVTQKDFNDKDEQAAWELLGRYEVIEPSFGFVERTLRRLDEAPASAPHRLWPLSVLRWAAAASLAVGLGLGGWLTWQRVQDQHRAEVYAQQDLLEDFDVIASLDQINGGSKL